MKAANFFSIWIAMVFFFLAGCKPFFAQGADAILQKIDGYRSFSDSFTLTIRISDYRSDKLEEEADFFGYFSGNDKSLLICTSGKNRRMKILMKGDEMWINLTGSKRALRITPMQRLMGEASNGDVAKVTFSQDYSGENLGVENGLLKLQLRAKRKGATYQKVILVVDPKTYQPIKADFFLLSGKHFKTAFYENFMEINGQRVVKRIKIVDIVNTQLYTVMENEKLQSRPIPEKYFNVMYLPQMEIE